MSNIKTINVKLGTYNGKATLDVDSYNTQGGHIGNLCGGPEDADAVAPMLNRLIAANPAAKVVFK